MKDPREEVGTKACIVGRSIKWAGLDTLHGEYERREITEII